MDLKDRSDESLVKELDDLRRELYSLRKSALLVEEELIAIKLEFEKRREAAKLKIIRFVVDDDNKKNSSE